MLNNSVSAIIVAKPGRRRDSLRAMLKAIPHLRIIGQVEDYPSTLKIVSKHLVKLVVLDCDQTDNDEIRSILRQINVKWPQTRLLALVETAKQKQMVKAAGADDVLVSGFSIADFIKTIERLLTDRDTPRSSDIGIQALSSSGTIDGLIGID